MMTGSQIAHIFRFWDEAQRNTEQLSAQQQHIRSPDCSRYQGNVREVLLEGGWNVDKERAERRCVVSF